MKRVLPWILGIVVVLVVAGAVLLGRIDTQFVVKQIADATAKATGKPLIFASAPTLSLLPPGVKFGQADWGEIKDGQGFAVSVRGGVVELELTPLLSGNLVVREVRLDNPVLEVREGKAVAAPAQPDQTRDQSSQGQSPADAAAPSDELPVELMRLVARRERRFISKISISPWKICAAARKRACSATSALSSRSRRRKPFWPAIWRWTPSCAITRRT